MIWTYCFPTQKSGGHIEGKPLSNFSFADDLAILAPSPCGENKLLAVCDDLAKENVIEFTAANSVVLLILPKTFKLVTKPNIYLGESVLPYVERFKCSVHFLTASFTDEEDIDREKQKKNN